MARGRVGTSIRLIVLLLLVLGELLSPARATTSRAVEPDRWEPLGGPPGVAFAARDAPPSRRIYALSGRFVAYTGAPATYVELAHSEDDGETWTSLALPPDLAVSGADWLGTDSATPGRLYVASFSIPGTIPVLARSDDGGATWPVTSTLPVTKSIQIVFQPSRPGEAFVAGYRPMRGDYALYRTRDGFATLQEVGTGFAGSGYPLIAVSAAQPGIVFALITITSGGCLGSKGQYDYQVSLHRSDDDGDSFRPVGTSLSYTRYCYSGPSWVRAINWGAGVPMLYFGDALQLFRVDVQGSNWGTLGNFFQRVFPVVSTSRPGELLTLNQFSRGDYHTFFWRSTNSGGSWTSDPNTSLPIGTPSGILPDPVNPDRMIAFGDRGVARSTDGGTTWRFGTVGLRGGAPGLVSSEPSSPYRLFTRIEVAAEHGSRWDSVPVGGRVYFSPGYAQNHTAFVLRGTDPDFFRLTRTTDAFSTTTTSLLATMTVRALRLSPRFDTDRTAYAVAAPTYQPERSLLVSQDGGANWEMRGPPGGVIPPLDSRYPESLHRIFSIAVDPLEPARLYLNVEAFRSGSPLGAEDVHNLLRSDDGGVSWVSVTPAEWRTLPQGWLGYNPPELDPVRPGYLYLVGSLIPYGPAVLMRSTDYGASWTQLAVPGYFAPQPFDSGYAVDGNRYILGSAATGGLYLSSAGGPVLRSRDAGLTWERLASGWPGATSGPAAATALEVRQGSPPVVYASGPGGLWRYVDLGSTLEWDYPNPLAIVRPGGLLSTTYLLRGGSATYTVTVATSSTAWLRPTVTRVAAPGPLPLSIDTRALTTGTYTSTLALAVEVPDVGVVTKTVPLVVLVGERWTSGLPFVPSGGVAGW